MVDRGNYDLSKSMTSEVQKFPEKRFQTVKTA